MHVDVTHWSRFGKEIEPEQVNGSYVINPQAIPFWDILSLVSLLDRRNLRIGRLQLQQSPQPSHSMAVAPWMAAEDAAFVAGPRCLLRFVTTDIVEERI
jgi:hypothetical protein